MADDKKPQDEMGPEKAVSRNHAVPDDGDTEGHTARFGRAIPDADKPGPDEAVRFKAIPDDADKPGPESSRGRP